MTFNDITNLLNTRLSQLSGSPPVAWPNVPYTPTTGVLYLRPTHLPAESATETLSYSESQQGIYQVDIIAPLDQGSGTAERTAEDIAAHFAGQRRLGVSPDLLRIRSISRNQGLRDDSYWIVSVSINYDTHIQR